MCSYMARGRLEVSIYASTKYHRGAIYMPYSRELDASIMNAIMTPYSALLLSTSYQVANAETGVACAIASLQCMFMT